MLLMLEVLKDLELHKRATAGYKLVGQSIDLYGWEDPMVCRATGEYWNKETTNGLPSMRQKINQELAAVEDEFASGGITWCERDVRRLISPYPAREAVDSVLLNLGDDVYHDDVHALKNGDDETAVADGDEVAAESSSDGDSGDGESADQVSSAVAGGGAEGAEIVEFAGPHVNSDAMCSTDSETLHAVKATIAALEGTLETLRSIGSVRSVQCIEVELTKERRKARRLVAENPAVADAFLQLR